MVQKGTRRSCCFRPIYLKIQADSRPHSPERFPLIVQPPWRRAYLSVISRMDLNQGGNHFRRINPISPARIVCSEETLLQKPIRSSGESRPIIGIGTATRGAFKLWQDSNRYRCFHPFGFH